VSVVVGYSSFGTFTTQFTKLVGLPPGRFRACAAPIAETPVRELLGHRLLDREPAAGCVRGQLSSRPDGSAGIALSGVFPSGIPQGRPLACAVVPPSGSVMLPAVDIPGDAEVLTVSFGSDATVRAVLTESPKAGFFFGATRMPGVRKGAAPLPRFSIQLRPPRATDPPLLIALPLLTAAP
jgi:AraC family transcriptional regulator